MAQKPVTVQALSFWSRWQTSIWGLLYLGVLALLVLFPGPPLLERLRWLDSGVCAQIPTHVFYPGGEELPLCARNTGIYLGFIVTLVTLYLRGMGRAQRLPPWFIILPLVCGIAFMAVDGFNSLALDLGLPHLYQPHNLLRLASGLLTGLALAILTLPTLNRLFWREYDERRSVPTFGSLLVFVPLLILCFFAVASQNFLVLYPLAILSTLGIITAVSIVNLIIMLALSKRDETFERYRELLPFLGLAFLLAIGEMLILAHIKLTLLQALGV